MANYITMALDPNAGHTFALMNDQIGNYQKNITRLEEELETILRTKNMTIVDLFHKIALRCFQFIDCRSHKVIRCDGIIAFYMCGLNKKA